jgi:uncharacterized membrane protein YdjX (TVP38/TMEM64 family)
MNNSISSRKKLILIVILVAIFVFSLVLVVIYYREICAFSDLGNIEQSAAKVKQWINSWGFLAPLIFILFQILQVVIFIIPGEVPEVAGGWLFGFWGGIFFSTVGIAIGSAVNFYLARFLGLAFVQKILPHKSLEKMQKLISGAKSALIYFIIFLIPGIPKDVIAYVAGLSKIRFWLFILISSGGRLLGLILSVIIGVALADGNWLLVVITAIIGIVLIIIGIIYRQKLYYLLTRLTKNPED